MSDFLCLSAVRLNKNQPWSTFTIIMNIINDFYWSESCIVLTLDSTTANPGQLLGIRRKVGIKIFQIGSTSTPDLHRKFQISSWPLAHCAGSNRESLITISKGSVVSHYLFWRNFFNFVKESAFCFLEISIYKPVLVMKWALVSHENKEIMVSLKMKGSCVNPTVHYCCRDSWEG